MDVTGDNTVVITSEALLEIIRSHFDRISPVQWTMLSLGTWDECTKNILLSMFVQLVQTLSTNILKLIIPMREVAVNRNEADSQNAFETISAILRESIGEIFAQVLEVDVLPLHLNPQSQELTVMLENEISQKVNHILFVASDGSTQPISVDSSLSSNDAKEGILEKAKHCLRACVAYCRCPFGKARSLSIDLQEKPTEPTVRAASDSAVMKPKKGLCRYCFSNFVKRNFNKKSNLTSKHTSVTLLEPESAPVTSAAQSNKESVSTVPSPIKSPEVDFENIQEEVDVLFEETELVINPEIVSNEGFQDFLFRNEISWFSQKLTHQFIEHLQKKENGQSPLSPFSNVPDSVLKGCYAMVEDEVSSLIQKLAVFLQDPPQDKFNILELSMSRPKSATCGPSPTPEARFKVSDYDIFELSMSRPKSAACGPSPTAEAQLKDSNYDISEVSVAQPKSFIQPNISADVTPPNVEAVKTTLGSPKSSQTSELSQSQVTTQYLITALLIKILKRKPCLSKQDKEYRAIIKRLTQKAWDEIEIPEDKHNVAQKNLRQIIRAVTRDLVKQYGSPTRLLAAALHPTDKGFEDNVVNILKAHLEIVLHSEKSAVAQFFSKVWRQIIKPFRCRSSARRHSGGQHSVLLLNPL